MAFLKLFFFILFVSISAHAAYVSDLNVLINDNAPAANNPLSIRLSDGTNYLSNLPVSQSGTWTIANTAFGISGTLPAFAATPTFNLGTLNGAATAANQTNGTQETRITDGTNDAAIKNTAPAGSDYGLIVRPVTVELPTFSVVATAVTVGNNKSMIALQNTGTSVVRIREIWVINDQTTAVTGVAGDFQVLRIASFTGGTALTPGSFDTIDTLPAGITAATGATVSTETTLLRQGRWSTDEWGPGTADTESFDHAIQNTRPFWEQTPNGKAITIRQNQAVHVKFATNSTAGAFNIRLIFTVE